MWIPGPLHNLSWSSCFVVIHCSRPSFPRVHLSNHPDTSWSIWTFVYHLLLIPYLGSLLLSIALFIRSLHWAKLSTSLFAETWLTFGNQKPIKKENDAESFKTLHNEITPAYSGVDQYGRRDGRGGIGTEDAIEQLMTIFQSFELYQYWSVRMSVTLGQKSDKVSFPFTSLSSDNIC